MKKTLLIFFLAIITLSVRAQQDTTKQKEEYCMLLATSRLFSTKLTITADFGQETHLFKYTDQRIKDEQGSVIKFNSVIDALNYMAKQGWLFVNAYVITVSNQSVYHYVLRRPLS